MSIEERRAEAAFYLKGIKEKPIPPAPKPEPEIELEPEYELIPEPEPFIKKCGIGVVKTDFQLGIPLICAYIHAYLMKLYQIFLYLYIYRLETSGQKHLLSK
jgi:hypothetical protein